MIRMVWCGERGALWTRRDAGVDHSGVAFNRCGGWQIVNARGVRVLLQGKRTLTPIAAPYFFGAAPAATGSAVNVPPASNGFTLIVPSSLVGDAIFAA